MKILVLVHEFPPVGGGGGHVAQDIARGLVQRGHEVTLATSHIKGLAREDVVDGIHVLRVPAMRHEAFRATFFSMAMYILVGLWVSLRLTKRWKPDAIHVHFAVPAGVLAWALSRIRNIPYLLTVHLGDVPGGAPKKTEKWFRWVFPFTRLVWRDAAQVVAVSEFTRQLALQHYSVDIKVIHNGVDTEKLRPKEIKIQSPPRIVFAGRFMRQKNPLQIVRTLSKLKDIPWQFVMIGDGPLFESVKMEIEKYGLEDRITLPGWISPAEVLDWFSQSDILFMPSLTEGMPVVGVQALSKGLALAVSNAGGFVDMVTDGENGFVMNANDAESMARKLRVLLTSRDLLLSFRESSLRRAKLFDLNRIVSYYENLFLELTRAKNKEML